MTTCPNLKHETEILKTKTGDDEIKNLKYQTEKHDHEKNMLMIQSMKVQ